MDEQSLVSDATTKEISDSSSNSQNQPIIIQPNTTSSKFKGVVSQPNGHWGAQIYANHHRIWLGTFKSENEAAMAYDSAAIRLRNGHTQRNFPWTPITLQEPSFQTQFNTEAILSMIKDGSYAARFSDFLRAHDQRGCQNLSQPLQSNPSDVKMRQLFEKELTPSDVGKLNRLVIPKRYAIKYFPGVSDANKKHNNDSYDLELIFFDRLMRSWKFRYCYWKSSQSFVFTRGWNGFAKEKGLRPRDRVIFSLYECNNQKICIIDVAYHDGAREDEAKEDCGREAKQSECPSNRDDESEAQNVERDVVEDAAEDAKVSVGFKLFGVQIV